MKTFLEIFKTNGQVNNQTQWLIGLVWLVCIFTFWTVSRYSVLPNAPEVASAGLMQWQQGAAAELITSFGISLQSIAIAAVLGSAIAYASTIPVFKLPVEWFSNFNKLSLSGIIVIFYMATPNGHALKVSVLVFAIVVFFLSDMLGIIDAIPQSRYDYARTLGLNRWQVLREVVIRGTLDQAFEALRVNAAMAWMMLTMVEGLSRSEGGIGVLLLNLARHQDLASVFAIQLVILAVGIGQDRLIRLMKHIVCPYAI